MSVTATEVASLGDIEHVKEQFGCTTRAATQLLTSAKRAVAQGSGARALELPARVTMQAPAPPVQARTAAQEEFLRVMRHLDPPEPTVDQRQYEQWQATQAEVVKRNIANGYGDQYAAD
jgi:hypothetical protein